MHTNKTWVSQAFPSVEGSADSPNDRIPPEAAGHFPSAKRHAIRMTNTGEGATAGGTQSTPGSLSEAQLATFWRGIVANLDGARRMAARFVPSQSVEDVVNTAAVLFVESAQRSKKPEPFPASEDRFRRKFLKMVRNQALDCVRDGKRPACPIHSHWGIDPEPVVGGHTVSNRSLDTVFARNDHGKYDAPAPAVRRAKDDLNGLHDILLSHMEDLSPTQREIILETYFEEQSREDIAERRGISLNTYDNHRKAACSKLRDSMMAVVEFSTDIDLPDWYDRIEEMSKRHAARQRRRASRKKEKRSTAEGDRPRFEGDRSKSRRNRERNARVAEDSVVLTTES
jgi:DNA-directed RNA polymerase specialized sigma24 family protein